ncbi:protein phosphatase CheZ [Halomonas sp. ISL-60]|uniref:protein phosphatase CheZ n=1 Tax=unclassified Halomonas TaxID=2609666 RepID=UPI0007DA07E7|nr:MULTISPECIES: protein phosphatase CheZ [unclassified Halomonas]MBT2771923.1 protein phosphatase CheZ [Halomonas sp. ISL-60]MBT2786555.1 protein phosphatase CheZ [Halomonas sp. ISL-106]MBT2797577.1 protein phosphatase CheZ [Halomonas sp. ISL-104]MBT2802891.1 protein phosphatase CheZ [Halomonas sp. ISL-56]OAL58927.1 protein phosphatase CheZ [Halomonas sp. ALS9]
MSTVNNAHDTTMPSVLGKKDSTDEMVHRIGHLTRLLRDSMKELGLDQQITQAAQAIPDANDRLNYVASMTEQAAERALNAVERAQPVQDSLEEEGAALNKRWQAAAAKLAAVEGDPQLVEDTQRFLSDKLPAATGATQKELLEIMMAQDFQDLTGQVIKKMIEVIKLIEEQLVQVLVDNVPNVTDGVKLEDDRDEHAKLRNGPQVGKDKTDVATGQDQVDDLLDELGF